MSACLYHANYEIFKSRMNDLYLKLDKRLLLIIGFSGGSDSSLLLDYLFAYKNEFCEKIEAIIVVHVIDGLDKINNNLVKFTEDSVLFIKKKVDYYGFKIEIYENHDITLLKKGESYEAVSHLIRKNFFLLAKKKHNADRILVAHNKDDQIEHFFIGIIRNSSLKRISGMKEDNGIFFRPLLYIEKKDIFLSLQEKNISYLTDPGNFEKSILRNKLRIDLIPQLNLIDSRFANGILSTMLKMNAMEESLEKYISELYKSIQEKDGYNIKKFLNCSLFEQYKLLEKIFFEQKFSLNFSEKIYKEIIRFLDSKDGGTHSIKEIVVIKIKKLFSLNKKVKTIF